MIIVHITPGMIDGGGWALGRDKSGPYMDGDGLNYGGNALFLRLFLAGAIISVMSPIEGISSAHLVFTDGHSLLVARENRDR